MKRIITLTAFVLLGMRALTASAQDGLHMYSALDAGTFGCGSGSFSDLNNTNYAVESYNNAYNVIWHKFTLTQTASVNVSLCGSGWDTYLYLVDQSGNIIGVNDDSPTCGSLSSYVSETSLSAGTYYIATGGYGSNTGNVSLELDVTGTGSASPGAGTANAISAGTFTSAGGTYTDTRSNNDPCLGNFVGQPSNDIFYQFTLNSAATVNISTCGSGIDTYLHLINAATNTEIAADDDGGCGNLTSAITAPLGAGTYYVVSEGYSSAQGSITTTISVGAGLQAPCITYATPETFYTGTAITALVPSNTCGAVSVGATSTFSTGFYQPLGAAVGPTGNVYIADAGSHQIYKITPAGIKTLLAGGGYTGFTNSNGSSALFYHPVGMAVDASGNVYVADEDNHAIRKIDPSGNVTTFAGTGSQGSTNGYRTSASFYYPCGVAVDASGNVYVADTYNNKIRKIDASGNVTTLAGTGTAGWQDGSGSTAKFSQPFSIVVDASGNLFVTDRSNHRIRKITPTGVVSTVAGSGTAAFADGSGTAASFSAPTGLTLDQTGNLYVTDENNQRVRKIDGSGNVSTFSGSGSIGSANGAGNVSTFYNPFGIAADFNTGNLYVDDDNNAQVRKLNYIAYTITPALPAGLSFDSATGTISGTPTSVSPATSYTITANNSAGSSSANITVSVVQPISQTNQSNPELNWIVSSVFDENGNLISSSKTFFDLSGKALQSQVKTITTGQVLASQTLDDLYGRPAISTLPAPINSSDFIYKPAFVSSAPNQAYNTTNFDGTSKLNNPDPVDQSTPGTLGWYYSNNNTLDAYVPATAYPYSRTDYFKDGTDGASRGAGVGEQLKMGMGHEPISNSFPVVNELSNYFSIRNRFLTDANLMGTIGQTSITGSAIQSISRDAQGNWAMAISDKDGHALMSALPGNWLTVNNTVTLSNYKEKFEINGTLLNLPLTGLKVTGAGQFIVLDNGSQIYQGSLSGYTIPATIAATETLCFLSNQPFTIQYSAQTTINTTDPVCENCHSQIQSGNVNGQDYHYFALPQGGNLNISGGTIQLVDLVANSTLYNNQGSQVSLPAGMYKAIVQTGTPQLSYTTSWGDISYNFYDQKGEAIASIAPNGVQQICANGVNAYADLAHLPFTNTVEYNKQGQVMASTSTDAGRSEFIYRRDGKIRFSQNSVQRNTDAVSGAIKDAAFTEKFSYTNYDDAGRPVESGEYVIPTGTSPQFSGLKTNTAVQESLATGGGLSGGTSQSWVRTHYDLPDNSHGQSGYIQDYLDGAVSWTENANAKTWYSYDEQGKVTWVIKYINGLGYKTIDYTYNYVGLVTQIAYQKSNTAESFYHHYTYDADQRLVNVQTSRDGVNKLQQANYKYYLHGPLKRVELGESLQGIDYVYTAQGLLKSINHASGDPAKDPGHDGQNTFAPDAFSMQMEYFNQDYVRNGSNISSVSTSQNYYTGNIAALGWQGQKPLGSAGAQSQAMYQYSYDNKSQLAGATWGTPNYGALNFTPQTKFSEKNLTYDPNGNIQGLQRTDSGGALSDDFSNYQYQGGTNKLNSVGNASGSQVYATYAYDDLGQLKSMQRTGSPFQYFIKYDVTGKIMGIYADAALTQLKIGYGYDETGNRISRTDNTGNSPTTTYYVHDASGNSLGIYSGTTLVEMPFYGSDRLGTYTLASNNYVYELRDNVGSVRVVINRNKKSDGTADIVTYNDYYPFGSIAQSGGAGYRYEYQGAYAEKDDITGFNNFELRMYDGRIGRWLSVDPMGQYASPYEGMGNNPVTGFDKTGGEGENDGKPGFFSRLWSSITNIFTPPPTFIGNQGEPLADVNIKESRWPKATETPGQDVYHNFAFGANWSFPYIGIHLSDNQRIGVLQHEYGHYLQWKKMPLSTYQYLREVAIPSTINLALIRFGLHKDDHDTQPYEIEASSLAEEYYGKNARLKEAGIPTYRSNPELQPKTFEEKIDEITNDVHREFNRWAQWGGR